MFISVYNITQVLHSSGNTQLKHLPSFFFSLFFLLLLLLLPALQSNISGQKSRISMAIPSATDWQMRRQKMWTMRTKNWKRKTMTA